MSTRRSRPAFRGRWPGLGWLPSARRVLCLGVFLGLGWGLGIASQRIALGLLIATPLILATSLKVYDMSGDLPAVALVVLIFTPPYMLKQYLLGFPDYDEIVLLPPGSPPRRHGSRGHRPVRAQGATNPAEALSAAVPEGPQVATAVSVLPPGGDRRNPRAPVRGHLAGRDADPGRRAGRGLRRAEPVSPGSPLRETSPTTS